MTRLLGTRTNERLIILTWLVFSWMEGPVKVFPLYYASGLKWLS